MVNHSIKIPEKHYLTFSSTSGEDAPLAFMTPYGTDSAAKKRMSTADNWAGGYGYHSTKKTVIDSKTVDNELLAGFKILTSVQRYSTSNVVWRILDPRGFELEISSGNMANLIALTTMENGEILTSCIWAREGPNNVLLSENDEEYKEAVLNSNRIKKSVSIRDVKIGNEVLFQKGDTGVYMGKFYSIHLGDSQEQDDGSGNYMPGGYLSQQRHSDVSLNKIEIANKSKHYFLIKGSSEGWNSGDRFMNISSPKLSEILSQDELSIDETEKMINDGFTSGTHSVVSGRNDTEYNFIGVMSSKITIDQLKVNLTKIDDPKSILDVRKKNAKDANIYLRSQSLIGKHGDNWIIVSSAVFMDAYSDGGMSGSIIDIDEFQKSIRIKKTHSDKYSSYRRNGSVNDDVSPSAVTWYMPTVVVISPLTSNKFEMLFPTC